MGIIERFNAFEALAPDLANKGLLALSGALIGYTVLQSWEGMLSGCVIAQIFNEYSPLDQLITTVSFTAITSIANPLITTNHLFSCAISLFAVYVTRFKGSELIIIKTGFTLVGTYVPSIIVRVFRSCLGMPVLATSASDWTDVALKASIITEIACSAFTGVFISFHALTGMKLIEGKKGIAAFSLLFAVSAVATYHLFEPHDLYSHAKLLEFVATIGAIACAGITLWAMSEMQNRNYR